MGALQNPASCTAYRLRFRSLSDERVAYAFPCDVAGCVDMDRLDERARVDYLFARAVMKQQAGALEVTCDCVE